MPLTQQLSNLLAEVVALSRQVAPLLLQAHEQPIDWQSKADRSPVTSVEQQVELQLLQGLQRLTPDIPMISEETSAPEFQQRRHWAWHWLIDPLDGTKEFLQGRDEYTSNIALVKGTQAVLGVIHVPAAATTYFAARGLGAWRQTAQMPPQKIHTRPWPVVPKVLVSRSHPGAVLQHLLAQQAAHDCLPMGSALKFCRLAAGEADMYPRLVPSSAWDTAAGQIVLEEAGGRLLTKMGLSLNYNQPSLLNPTFIAFGADSGVDLQTWLAQL